MSRPIVSPKLKSSTKGNNSSLRQTKEKKTIGYYPAPAAFSAPPDFGPNCVPPAVARQIDAHMAELNRAKEAKKAKKMVEVKETNTRIIKNDPQYDVEKFQLCVPQNPARFSALSVNDSNHPRPSLLQNPQRIVAEGPFAVNEAVKPSVVSIDFDGLQPLRLNQGVSNPDTKKTLRDLQLLVQASLRSRNIKDESSAYFNIGLLYESEGHLKKANKYYMKYLQTLGADADPLVFNRIAVNYQLMNMFEEAIEWNMRHLSFSRSMFETIAANCNIALIYRAKGDNARSVEFYQAALDTATEMNEAEDSPFYEQIEKIRGALKDELILAERESLVNDIGATQLSQLAFGDRLKKTDIGRRQIDAEEQYYSQDARISQEQGDLSTAYNALISNGKLNCFYGDFERAEKFYLEALEVAKKIGSSDLVNHAKVAIGIVRGNKDMKIYGLFDEVGVPDPSLFTKDDPPPASQ